MDAFARSLKIAARIIQRGQFARFIRNRYKGWDTPFGRKIEQSKATFTQMEKHTLKNGEPQIQSVRQEMLENILNEYIR
jgi:xylose isomerase